MTLEQLNICATFFGALVALVIFSQWRNQKGSEVVSVYAKEIFGLIEELPKHMNIVMEDMLEMALNQKVPNDFNKERYDDFMYKNIHIIKMLKLIKFKNKDKETVGFIDKFGDSYENFATFYKQSHPINLDFLLESKDVYKKSFEELKEEMYKYALFKKTI